MPSASSTAGRAGLAACAAWLSFIAAAHGEVLEIGGDGQVTRYDRPAVFGDAGAAPIDHAPSSPPAAGQGIRQELAAAAAARSLSPALVEALARQESGLRPEAVSPAGAAGVMQLMPSTARDLGVDRFDTRQNIHGGVAYLAQMLDRFDGDLVRAPGDPAGASERRRPRRRTR